MSSKPSIPKGTRDFGPDKMVKRNYMFEKLRKVFQIYGYQPIETPAMENLSVLMGKYGEEGDQLLFKILNSGDYLSEVDHEDISKGAKSLVGKIAEKGLRYDLTVPFARYVVMNRNEISLPFKRYQMQPVWRADRPQKGRYREFFQCDADVVGTDSLLCEAEIIGMLVDGLSALGLDDFTIKINNRKILTGISEAIGAPGKEAELCIAIDKLDKIGFEKVKEELRERNISEQSITKLEPVILLNGSNSDKLKALAAILTESEIGKKGLEELQEVFRLAENLGYDTKGKTLEFDVTLARGLSYYTGAIFEVKANNVSMGSICGGGRYDNLTGAFGMPGLSGVGISFGVDRIYDVLEELKLFPEQSYASTQVLITNFDKECEGEAIRILAALRKNSIKSELYPESSKLKKQFGYADDKKIPFVLVVGSEEIQKKQYSLKDMKSGDQQNFSVDQLIDFLKTKA